MKQFIKIYQIKDIEKTNYAFRSYNENLFNFNDYKEVLHVDLPDCLDASDIDLCDHYWGMLNADRTFAKVPKYSYEGHSPSVSDIFCVNGNYYYCNNIGWINITGKCSV